MSTLSPGFSARAAERRRRQTAAKRCYRGRRSLASGWEKVVRGVINRIIDDLVTRFEYRVAQFRDWSRYNSARTGARRCPRRRRPRRPRRSHCRSAYEARERERLLSSVERRFGIVCRPQHRTDGGDGSRRPTASHGGNAAIRTVSGRGTTVKGLVRLPGQTVREVHTLTTQQIATVTDVQPVTVTAPPVTVTAPPVTVTVVETVKCKPKDC